MRKTLNQSQIECFFFFFKNEYKKIVQVTLEYIIYNADLPQANVVLLINVKKCLEYRKINFRNPEFSMIPGDGRDEMRATK